MRIAFTLCPSTHRILSKANILKALQGSAKSISLCECKTRKFREMVHLTSVHVKQNTMLHGIRSSFSPCRAATEHGTSAEPQDHNSCTLYKLITRWVSSLWGKTVSSVCKRKIWGCEISQLVHVSANTWIVGGQKEKNETHFISKLWCIVLLCTLMDLVSDSWNKVPTSLLHPGVTSLFHPMTDNNLLKWMCSDLNLDFEKCLTNIDWHCCHSFTTAKGSSRHTWCERWSAFGVR